MKKSLLPAILGIIIVVGGYLLIFGFNKDNKKTDDISSSSSAEEIISKVKIVDENSKTRPYAVMVNNIAVARPLQSGLQDAYIVYEIVVEGGITRFMALFKDTDTKRIGSVRSARHYYLDYALENDAIYVHWGESPQAQSDVQKLGVTEIDDGVSGSTWSFRDTKLKVDSEHTLFATMSGLNKVRDNKISRKTTNKDLLLNYSAEEHNYEGKEAKTISIKYSTSMTAKYVYNEENKNYDRFVNGKTHNDYVTKKQYTAKNIIAYSIDNYTLPNQDKPRQELENIGSGTGYYFSNGISTVIKWSKSSRGAQTKYTTEDGKELIVNDGNTFIQIYPKSGSLSFE